MWMSVDPLALSLSQFDKSPYNYANNNPLIITDPDGEHPVLFIAAIVLLLVATPTPLNAPTINAEANKEVMDNANDFAGMWVALALGGGAAACSNGIGGFLMWMGEESLSTITGLPFSVTDVFDVAKSINRVPKIFVTGHKKTLLLARQ